MVSKEKFVANAIEKLLTPMMKVFITRANVDARSLVDFAGRLGMKTSADPFLHMIEITRSNPNETSYF